MIVCRTCHKRHDGNRIAEHTDERGNTRAVCFGCVERVLEAWYRLSTVWAESGKGH